MVAGAELVHPAHDLAVDVDVAARARGLMREPGRLPSISQVLLLLGREGEQEQERCGVTDVQRPRQSDKASSVNCVNRNARWQTLE